MLLSLRPRSQLCDGRGVYRGQSPVCSHLGLSWIPRAGEQALRNLPLCFTDEQAEAQEVREEEEALQRCAGRLQGCQEERAPPGPARPPLLPQLRSPSARLGSVGPYLVPMSLSSSSLTSSTWRKTGSWALPGIRTHPSSALGREATAVVGGSAGRTWDRVWGRGSAGRARVAWVSLPR